METELPFHYIGTYYKFWSHMTNSVTALTIWTFEFAKTINTVTE